MRLWNRIRGKGRKKSLKHPGRPPKHKEDRVTEMIQVRLTRGDYARLSEYCDGLGKPASRVLREMVLELLNK